LLTGLLKVQFWFISLLLADMWHCYGLLVAQIWQTGVGHPRAVIPRCMWARPASHKCQMWAGSGPKQCCYVGPDTLCWPSNIMKKPTATANTLK